MFWGVLHGPGLVLLYQQSLKRLTKESLKSKQRKIPKDNLKSPPWPRGPWEQLLTPVTSTLSNSESQLVSRRVRGLIPPCPILSPRFLKGQETQFCSVLLHLTVIFSRTRWFTLGSDSVPWCSWAEKWLGAPKAKWCEFKSWFCPVLAMWLYAKLFKYNCLSSFFSKMGMAKEPTTRDYCEG